MHLAESSSTSFCLWTGLSLPVALHLASQRRSYLQLRTGQCSRPERTFTLLLVRTFRRTYPGTSCLATISLSLRDKSHRLSKRLKSILELRFRTWTLTFLSVAKILPASLVPEVHLFFSAVCLDSVAACPALSVRGAEEQAPYFLQQ